MQGHLKIYKPFELCEFDAVFQDSYFVATYIQLKLSNVIPSRYIHREGWPFWGGSTVYISTITY